ncbi:hypothetical protein G9C98_002951 [Cotesia typhae]|uniref:Microtubule-associated protein futsch n=1 Tax=Cotesia typhae TaxID=2053667 RepID=A0A8J5VC91_9HYME|nr:hypothetical protein G9C98_002951 [Cotesia typhae]
MDSFEKTIERKEESPVLNQTTNDPGAMVIDTTNMISTTPGSHQHPPPSPLSGCYLLVVLPEPHAIQHKHFILNKLAKGFLSWDKENCHVDLEKELEALVAQSPEGEEARNGERLIQYATENLVTEILIHPQTNTLLQCIRNLLASFTKHRHIIHAGYTFSENGSWILQDGTFSLADFFDAFNEHDVQRVLRAYENNVTIDISCAGIGEWSTERLSQEPSTRSCRIRLNPEDILSTRLPAITSFINYIEQYLVTQTLAQLMQPSDVVGNIRFSHPTLYVFPGGQGDAALFGINGFNMLVDGGFARKSCFWDFTRHLDRLDAVLFTRVNNSNIGGMSSFLRKKKETQVYPQIGHFFGNIFESKQLRSSDDNKDDDPLIFSLIDLGQELVTNLKHIHLRPHLCYRRQDPINLYHKVGHGTLDMYVLSPVKDSREVKDFLSKWTAADHKLFADSHKKDSNNFAFPIRNMVSICALIVWQPANPEDTITRILFPGSTPQHTIFEGIERLKHLEFLKHSTCSAKNLSPAISLATSKEKSTKLKMNQIDRETKRTNETKITKRETSEVKVPKIESQSQKQETKTKKTSDLEIKKVDNAKEYSKTMIDLKESKKNEKDIKDMKKESKKDSQKESEGKKFEMIKTNEEDKNIVNKELKRKIERKKQDPKDSKEIKVIPPVGKIENKSESTNKKMKISASKKPLTGLPTKPELLKTSMPKTTSKPSAKQIYPPAKSTKDANNRKVLEQKNIEKITSKQKPSPPVASAEKKPVVRRIKSTSSPSKNRLPGSPMKVAKVTSTVPTKLEKDTIQKKLKNETEAADSSTVSTSSVVDMDSMKFVDKCLTEKSEDMSLDSIENKVLADLKEERQVVEEIEAVLQKAERIENTRDNLIKDKHDVSVDTGKKYEDLTEDDVTVEMDEIPRKSTSRKASQELTEEDEYLIIEKEEMYTEDSVHSTEKDTVIEKGIVEEQEKSDKKIHDDSEIEKKELQSTIISVSKNKKLEEEKIKGVTSATTDITSKKDTQKELVETDSEVVNKEPLSSSPEKLNLEQKAKIDPDSKPEIGKDTQIREKFEESLERVSTLESGATTTAPTLPEDERISIEGMKPTSSEIVKQGMVEDIKKIETFAKSKTIPLAPIEVPELKFTNKEITQQPIPALPRDIVKTPDEVADLPVHEEVDPKLYEIDNYDTSKEDKNQYTKESVISFKEQKNIPEVYSKATDKCEKGIDKMTESTRRDSEKDIDEKLFSKSGSPKKSFDADPLLSDKKTEKDHQLIHDDQQVDTKQIMGPKKEGKEIDIPETILIKKKIILDTHSLEIGEVNENVESVEDVEVLLEEASKKFKTVKDSLRDSLESLEEHIVEEFKKTTLELDNDNEIEGKLNKVAEKLEEIEPRKQNISTDITAQNIKSDVLKSDSSDCVERSDTISPVKNIKDAVKDVGEVLAGTAGIIIDDKPKDVIDIVKKVAEVLKEDSFLPVQYLIQDKLKTEVEEDLKDKKLSQDHHMKVLDTSSSIRSRSESITEAKLMCAELLKDDVVPHLQESALNEDIKSSDVDVLEVGIEKVCEKVNTNLQKDDSHQAISDVVTSEIAFDHKMIPTTAEVVLITPDSMPPSPKLSIELQEETSVTEDVRNIIKNKDNIYDIIKDILLIEKSMISDQVLEFISISKQIPKQQLIVIIDQIISKEYLLQSKVDEASKMSKVEKETADDIKKYQLEDYIQENYLKKNTPITLEILEEIALKYSYPRFLIIEIIESIITMKGMTKSSVINISEKALIQLAQENVPKQDQKSSLVDKATDDIQYDEVAQIPDKVISEINDFISKEFIEKKKIIEINVIDRIHQQYFISKRIIIEIINNLIINKKLRKQSVVDSAVWDSYESSDETDEILKTVRKDENVNKAVSDSSKDSSERSEKGSATEGVDEIELNNRDKIKYRDEKEETIEDIEKGDKNFDTESNIKLAKSSLTSLETTPSSETILTSDLKEQIIFSKEQKGAEDEKMNIKAVQDEIISQSITPSTKYHSVESEVSKKVDEKSIHTIDNSLTKTDKPLEFDNSEISGNELSLSRKHSISKDQHALIEGEKDDKISDTQIDDLSIIPKVLKTETEKSCELDDEEDKKTAEGSSVYDAAISLDKMKNLEEYSTPELDIIDSSSSQALITPTQDKYPVDSAENVQDLMESHITSALPESGEKIELYKHQEEVKPQTFSKTSSPTSDKSLTENRRDEPEVLITSKETQPDVVPENIGSSSTSAESKYNDIEIVASQLDISHPHKKRSIDQEKEDEIQKKGLVTSIDTAFVSIEDTIDRTEEQNEGMGPLIVSKSPSDKSLSEHGENKIKILTEEESKEVEAPIHSKSPSPTSHKSIIDDHKDKTEDLTIPTKSTSSAFAEKAESSSSIAGDKHDDSKEIVLQQNSSTDQEISLIDHGRGVEVHSKDSGVTIDTAFSDIQDTNDQTKKQKEEKSPILSKSTSSTSDKSVTDDHKDKTEDLSIPTKSVSSAFSEEADSPSSLAGEEDDDIEEATSQDKTLAPKIISIDQGQDIDIHRKDSIVAIDTASGDIQDTDDQPKKQKEDEKLPILSKTTSPTSDKSVIDVHEDKIEDLIIPTKIPSSAVSKEAESSSLGAEDKSDNIEGTTSQDVTLVQMRSSIDQGKDVEVHRKDSVGAIDTACGDIQDTTDLPKKQREEEKSPILSKSTSPTSVKSVTDDHNDKTEDLSIPTKSVSPAFSEKADSPSSLAGEEDDDIEEASSQDKTLALKRISIDQGQDVDIHRKDSVVAIDTASGDIQDTNDQPQKQREEEKSPILPKSTSPTSDRGVTDDHKDKIEDIILPSESSSFAVPKEVESSTPVARDEHDDIELATSQHDTSPIQTRSSIDRGKDVEVHRKDSVVVIDTASDDIQDTTDLPKKQREEEKSPILTKSTSPISDQSVTDDHKDKTEDLSIPTKLVSSAFSEKTDSTSPVAGKVHDDIGEATSQDKTLALKIISIDQSQDVDIHRNDSVVAIDTASGDIQDTNDQPQKQREEEKSPILTKSTSPISDKSVTDDHKDKTEDLSIPTKLVSSAFSEKTDSTSPVAGKVHDDIGEATSQDKTLALKIISIDQGQDVDIHRKDSVVAIDTASGDIQDTNDQPQKQKEEAKSPILSKSTSPTSDKSVIDDHEDKSKDLILPTKITSSAVSKEAESSSLVGGDKNDNIEKATSQDVTLAKTRISIDHGKDVDVHRKDSAVSIDTASGDIQDTTDLPKKQREEEKSPILSKSTSPTSVKSVTDDHNDKTEDLSIPTKSVSPAFSEKADSPSSLAGEEDDDIEEASSQDKTLALKRISIDQGQEVDVHRKDSVVAVDTASRDIQDTNDQSKKPTEEDKSPILPKSTSPTSDRGVTDDHKDKIEDIILPSESSSFAVPKEVESSTPVARDEHDDIELATSQHDTSPFQTRSSIDQGKDVDVHRKDSVASMDTDSCNIQNTIDQPQKQKEEAKSPILPKSTSPTSDRGVTDDHKGKIEDILPSESSSFAVPKEVESSTPVPGDEHDDIELATSQHDTSPIQTRSSIDQGKDVDVHRKDSVASMDTDSCNIQNTIDQPQKQKEEAKSPILSKSTSPTSDKSVIDDHEDKTEDLIIPTKIPSSAVSKESESLSLVAEHKYDNIEETTLQDVTLAQTRSSIDPGKDVEIHRKDSVVAIDTASGDIQDTNDQLKKQKDEEKLPIFSKSTSPTSDKSVIDDHEDKTEDLIIPTKIPSSAVSKEAESLSLVGGDKYVNIKKATSHDVTLAKTRSSIDQGKDVEVHRKDSVVSIDTTSGDIQDTTDQTKKDREEEKSPILSKSTSPTSDKSVTDDHKHKIEEIVIPSESSSFAVPKEVESLTPVEVDEYDDIKLSALQQNISFTQKRSSTDRGKEIEVQRKDSAVALDTGFTQIKDTPQHCEIQKKEVKLPTSSKSPSPTSDKRFTEPHEDKHEYLPMATKVQPFAVSVSASSVIVDVKHDNIKTAASQQDLIHSEKIISVDESKETDIQEELLRSARTSAESSADASQSLKSPTLAQSILLVDDLKKLSKDMHKKMEDLNEAEKISSLSMPSSPKSDKTSAVHSEDETKVLELPVTSVSSVVSGKSIILNQVACDMDDNIGIIAPQQDLMTSHKDKLIDEKKEQNINDKELISPIDTNLSDIQSSIDHTDGKCKEEKPKSPSISASLRGDEFSTDHRGHETKDPQLAITKSDQTKSIDEKQGKQSHGKELESPVISQESERSIDQLEPCGDDRSITSRVSTSPCSDISIAEESEVDSKDVKLSSSLQSLVELNEPRSSFPKEDQIQKIESTHLLVTLRDTEVIADEKKDDSKDHKPIATSESLIAPKHEEFESKLMKEVLDDADSTKLPTSKKVSQSEIPVDNKIIEEEQQLCANKPVSLSSIASCKEIKNLDLNLEDDKDTIQTEPAEENSFIDQADDCVNLKIETGSKPMTSNSNQIVDKDQENQSDDLKSSSATQSSILIEDNRNLIEEVKDDKYSIGEDIVKGQKEKVEEVSLFLTSETSGPSDKPQNLSVNVDVQDAIKIIVSSKDSPVQRDDLLDKENELHHNGNHTPQTSRVTSLQFISTDRILEKEGIKKVTTSSSPQKELSDESKNLTEDGNEEFNSHHEIETPSEVLKTVDLLKNKSDKDEESKTSKTTIADTKHFTKKMIESGEDSEPNQSRLAYDDEDELSSVSSKNIGESLTDVNKSNIKLDEFNEERKCLLTQKNDIEKYIMSQYVIKGRKIVSDNLEEIVNLYDVSKNIVVEIIEEICNKKNIEMEFIFPKDENTKFNTEYLVAKKEIQPTDLITDKKVDVENSEFLIKNKEQEEMLEKKYEFYDEKEKISITEKKIMEVESKIQDKYINENNKISWSDLDEMEKTLSVPRYILIEIIEKLIIKMHLSRKTIFDQVILDESHDGNEIFDRRSSKPVTECKSFECSTSQILDHDNKYESQFQMSFPSTITEMRTTHITTFSEKSADDLHSDPNHFLESAESSRLTATSLDTTNIEKNIISDRDMERETEKIKDILVKGETKTVEEMPEYDVIIKRTVIKSSLVEPEIKNEDESKTAVTHKESALEKKEKYETDETKQIELREKVHSYKSHLGMITSEEKSGRSTPERRDGFDSCSRTATPEGFRSEEVIRTTITTTRTISNEGEIVTTTKEVTETTNEHGETIVLAEKVDVTVADQGSSLTKLASVETDQSSEIQKLDSSCLDLQTSLSDSHDSNDQLLTDVWPNCEETTPKPEIIKTPSSISSQVYHCEIQSKPVEFSTADMSSSFYGQLPSTPPCHEMESSITLVSSDDGDDFTFKKVTTYDVLSDDMKLHQTANIEKDDESEKVYEADEETSVEAAKDPLKEWGKPMKLPPPERPDRFNFGNNTLNRSINIPSNSSDFDILHDWGKPMELPSPAFGGTESSDKTSSSTPRKDNKQSKKIISENLKNKKHSESPSKSNKKSKEVNNKIQPIYLDLTFVPHHGNSYYTSFEFFKQIRARYYVFSGTEPSRDVYDALLNAKKTWENKDLEVTIIPTYDTDTLGYWVADNEEALAENHIDLSPSASRCTINLQDHETSCSAYRLEF